MPTKDHAHICRPDIVGSLHRSGTWLLLRGLTREAGHWGDFPRQLQAALPEARILAIDLPGNGTLHRQASARQGHIGINAPRDKDGQQRDKCGFGAHLMTFLSPSRNALFAARTASLSLAS